MIAHANSAALPTLDVLHVRYLALLPKIETHARIYFRHIHCPDGREELVQEAIALTWKWFLCLSVRGKDPGRFITALARYAACAVKCGRRLVGQEWARDVMSPVAQRRRGFRVERLPISTRTALEDLYSDPMGSDIWMSSKSA